MKESLMLRQPISTMDRFGGQDPALVRAWRQVIVAMYLPTFAEVFFCSRPFLCLYPKVELTR